MDIPVTAPGVRRTITLDGARYVLAAPTLDQAGAMLAAAMDVPPVGSAVLRDAMRQHLVATSRAELAEALSTLDGAEDELAALLNTAPPQWDGEGGRQWAVEHYTAIRDARGKHAAATRAASIAEHAAWNAPEVVQLRATQAEAQIAAARRAVATCLQEAPDWSRSDFDGPDDALAFVGTLPMPHVFALAAEAQRLLNPTADAAKN